MARGPHKCYTLVVVTISLILVMYLTLIFAFQPPSHPDVTVTFVGYTNSAEAKTVALIALYNNGGNVLRREHSCTISWTNSIGIFTNRFFTLVPTNYLLRGGSLETVRVAPPPDPGPWKTCFEFVVEPSEIQRLVRRIHNAILWFLSSEEPTSHFFFIGPEITGANLP
jgi:hypothetical protein